MSVELDPDAQTLLTQDDLDRRIRFLENSQFLEIDLSGLKLASSADANALYGRIEGRVAASDEDQWIFLINYFGASIDPAAWFTFSRRGAARRGFRTDWCARVTWFNDAIDRVEPSGAHFGEIVLARAEFDADQGELLQNRQSRSRRKNHDKNSRINRIVSGAFDGHGRKRGRCHQTPL